MVMEKLWLSEAMKEYKKTLNYGVLNLINAPAGSGKTSFIFKDLIENYKTYGIKRLRLNKIIYLCDTSSLKDKVLKESSTKKYEYGDLDNISNDDCKDGKIIVMTYAMLGTLLDNPKNKEKILNSDAIIFDEVHQIPIYSYKFDKNVKGSKKRSGVYNNILKHMSDLIKSCNCIGLSATIFENELNIFRQNGCNYKILFEELSELDNIKSYNFEPRHINSTFNILKEYVIFNELFKNTEYNLKKVLIYTQKTEQAERYKKYLIDNGIKAEWLCSENAKDEDENGKKIPKMNDYQIKLREDLIEAGEVHSDIQVLIINAAYETGIDIYDNKKEFQCVIVDSRKDVTRIQARNRIRHNINELYVLDKFEYDWSCNTWSVPVYNEYKTFLGFEDDLYIPNLTTYIDDKYLNVRLTPKLKSEMKEKYSTKKCNQQKCSFDSIIDDINERYNFKVFIEKNKGTWIFKRDEINSYLKTNGLKYSDEAAKSYIKFLNKGKEKVDDRKHLYSYLESIIGKKLYVKDLEKKELIEKVNVRKNGKFLKNMDELNDKLKKENIPYEIIDNTDWNRKLEDGSKNKNYGKKYWLVKERCI